ncbi:MAG: hypothetical protein R2764_18195 [Bacteroidales bacterium]
MKKLIQFFLLILSLSALTQEHDNLTQSAYCSHWEFYKNNLSPFQIYQTPLLNEYDVNYYFLDLNVENNTIFLSGNVTITANVIANTLDTFAFELVNQLSIDSIRLDGIIHDYYRENDEVFVPLSFPVQEGAQFISQIFYHGTPPTGGFFSGISTTYDSIWNKHVTWTLSEPFNAR